MRQLSLSLNSRAYRTKREWVRERMKDFELRQKGREDARRERRQRARPVRPVQEALL